MQRKPTRRAERGVAIITAMLIVALGTITMVAITSRQQLDMQRERNEGAIQMARDLAASGERFAAALLWRDVQEKAREGSDSLEDDWATTIPPVPIDDIATLQGCIVDMQGHFNLNNLVDVSGRPDPIYVGQFERLLFELGIDTTKVAAVIDWIDPDIDAIPPDGAEDDYYTGLDPAYRAANAPFSSVSELQLVKGFGTLDEGERKDYERLVPYVAALPTTRGPTKLNVNTAPPPVIASLGDREKVAATELSRWDTGAYEDYPECENIFDLEAETPEVASPERDFEPFTSVGAFTSKLPPAAAASRDDPNDPNVPATDDRTPAIDVKSSWFEIRIDVLAEGLRLSQFALFERDGQGRTRLVRRMRDTI